MTFSPVDPRVEAYQRTLLARHDEPVLLEMEALARENGFPIVGRICGAFLEVLALSIGARTVFELGSGYGYSAYWFTRAVGVNGRVYCTDGEENNRVLAEDYLTRVGRWDRVEYHVDWAQKVFDSTPGEFDIVYSDVDKEQYPDTWLQARSRVRPGGLYICDNVIWSGRVTPGESDDTDQTVAIQRHNDLVSNDPDFDVFINPSRDGLIVARRRV